MEVFRSRAHMGLEATVPSIARWKLWGAFTQFPGSAGCTTPTVVRRGRSLLQQGITPCGVPLPVCLAMGRTPNGPSVPLIHASRRLSPIPFTPRTLCPTAFSGRTGGAGGTGTGPVGWIAVHGGGLSGCLCESLPSCTAPPPHQPEVLNRIALGGHAVYGKNRVCSSGRIAHPL